MNAIGAEQVYIMTERLMRTEEEVRKQFDATDPGMHLWMVAEVDGVLAGGADFGRSARSKDAHVAQLGIALAKAFRGLGIGDAMMRAGIEWARAVGVQKLRLGVFATNAPAIALYRKLGFQEEGRLKDEVVIDGSKGDVVLMALHL